MPNPKNSPDGKYYTIFNSADIGIYIGVVLIMIDMLFLEGAHKVYPSGTSYFTPKTY